MNDSRPPMILEHYSVTQKSDQEVIHWMTQKFRNNVELIRRLENSKNDLRNVVGLLVSTSKWLEGKHRVGTRMLSVSMDQIHLLESYTKKLLDESIIREMGTTRLQKKINNLKSEERMLIENFNNVLKEYIKFDEQIQFNIKQCRAARAVEAAYSMQSTCNSEKLQSLNDAMHYLFRDESTMQNMLRYVAAQLVNTKQDHHMAHFSVSLAENIFFKGLKDLSITEKSLIRCREDVHELQESNKKKLIQFGMLSNLLIQIDHENDCTLRILLQMERLHPYTKKSITILDAMSVCCNRVRTQFVSGKQHGLYRFAQLEHIQYLLGRLRSSLTHGNILKSYIAYEKLLGTLKLMETLCFLLRENQGSLSKRESMRQHLLDELEILGSKEAEFGKRKSKFNQLNYETDRYQIKAEYQAARFLTMAQAALNIQKKSVKQASLHQKEVNRMKENIQSLKKIRVRAKRSLGDARKVIASLKTGMTRQERLSQNPAYMEVLVDTGAGKMKEKSALAHTTRQELISDTRAYLMCNLALEEAIFQDK